MGLPALPLEETTLYRYLKSGLKPGRFIRYTFIDENYKITSARYKLVGFQADPPQMIWRLDGRSVRYVKRVRIIENTIKGAHQE